MRRRRWRAGDEGCRPPPLLARLVTNEAACSTGGERHVGGREVAASVFPAHGAQARAPAPPLISLGGNRHVRARLLASLHQPSDSEPEALGWAKKWDFNFPDIPVCLRAGSGRTCATPNLRLQTSGVCCRLRRVMRGNRRRRQWDSVLAAARSPLR